MANDRTALRIVLCEEAENGRRRDIGFISNAYNKFFFGELTSYFRPVVKSRYQQIAEIEILPLSAYFTSNDYATLYVHLVNFEGKPLSGVMPLSHRQVAHMIQENIHFLNTTGMYKLTRSKYHMPLGCKAETRAFGHLRRQK